MTTAEARAAAERLQIYSNDPGNSPGATWKWGDADFGFCTVVADTEALARFVLGLTDETPADEAWLRSVGFKHSNGYKQMTYGNSNTYGWSMTYFTDGSGDMYIKAAKWCSNPTRGRVLSLMAALGIPATTTKGGE